MVNFINQLIVRKLSSLAALQYNVAMLILLIKKVYRWIQATSLDVVVGSGLLTLSIAKYYKVSLPVPVVSCLMIAVWLIYTFDHLSDAKKIGKRAATFRHRFHQQYYKPLQGVLIFVLLAGVAAVCFLPPVIVKNGVICASIVFFYFMLLKLRSVWFKELLIAFCYTAGVFLGPLSLTQEVLTIIQLLLIPQVFLLALANLIIFSCFDYENDKKDAQYSLAIHLGLLRSRSLALGLVAAGFIISLLMFFSARLMLTIEIQILIFIMNLLLLFILLKEEHFRRNELYRVIGDGIFFIPALILLYAW